MLTTGSSYLLPVLAAMGNLDNEVATIMAASSLPFILIIFHLLNQLSKWRSRRPVNIYT